MMKRIDEIDKNFKTGEAEMQDGNVYEATDDRPELFGIYFENGYRRMPEEIAKSINENVEALHTHTSGGRLRFRTDSSYINFRCELPTVFTAPHIPLTGTTGFDIYEDNRFKQSCVPPLDVKDGYSTMIQFPDSTMRDIMFHFPLYNEVSRVYIELEEGAQLQKASPYKNKKPVVFYGSSITQGACASRPGNAYPAILSRRLDFDFINLGFSGGCLGEENMAEYIAALDMEILVMDYDHNAPNAEHLEKTHEKFFQIIREKNPTLPVVFITRPDFIYDPTSDKRQAVIRETYENARAKGDPNVYFIDGKELWGDEETGSCTVDRIHPADLGHWRMAGRIEPVLREILENL